MKDPLSLLPWGWSCHGPQVICHMVLNIRIKMSLCFLWEMLKFIRKSESLIFTKFLSPAICCMRKKMEIFFNHLLIVKCESADVFEKAGLGAEWRGGSWESQNKPTWQGEIRLAAEWWQSVGKHNYGNHLSQSFFFLLLTTCSFHTGIACREASFGE